MRDLRPFLCAAALALPALSRPAWAQAPTGSASPTIAAAPVEAMTAKARELYADGLKAFQKQKWAEAYAAFTGAWALQKHYAVAGNLGAAEVQLGRYRDAAEHLAIYTRGITEDRKRTDKERESAKLLFEVAASKIVTVTVTVNVAGADVWIDSTRTGAAPLPGPVFLEPGKHTVEVKLDGYATDKRDFEVAAGEKKAFEVVLSKRPEVAPAAPPSATVTAPPPRSMVPAYVVGGVGVASLIAGGVLLGVALAEKSDLASKLPRDEKGNLLCARTAPDAHPDCAVLRAQATQLDAFGNAGITSMVVGGVVVAGAVAYYLWPASRSGTRGSNSHILPVAGRDGGGVVWMGRF